MNQQQELDCAIDWATYMEQQRQKELLSQQHSDEWAAADMMFNVTLVAIGVAMGIMLMLALV